METSMKCVFCLQLIDTGNTASPDLSMTESLADSFFKTYPEYLPRKILMDGLKEASYCTPCQHKTKEVHRIQTNLRIMEKRLQHVISDLETGVIDHYKSFQEKEAHTFSDSTKVMDLRIKFYKLALKISLEEGASGFEINAFSPSLMPYTFAMKLSDSEDVDSLEEPQIFLSEDRDDDDLYTPDPLELQSTASDSDDANRTATTRRTTRKRKVISRRSEEAVKGLKNPKLMVLRLHRIPDDGLAQRLLPSSTNTKSRKKKLNKNEDDIQQNDEIDDPKINRRKRATKKKKCLRCTHSGCTKVFRSETYRFAHIKYDHEGIEKPFKCDECANTFITLTGLTGHQRGQHSPPKPLRPFPCTFPGCKRSFVEENIRFFHIKKVHEGVTVFKCSYCEKAYSKPCKLRDHERSHTGEYPFECTTCHKRFSTKSYLSQHSRLHMDKYACDICGKPGSSRLALAMHKHTHSAAKVFVCELCGYACTSKHYLESHQANQHEHETGLEAIKCHICGKYLSSKCSLEGHLVSIHKIGKPKFQCQHCPSTFVSQRDCRIHTDNIHLNLKNYECIICNKRFGTRGNVRSHHERHHLTKEQRPRPFECPTCNKRFFTNVTMRNHMAIHSEERPFPCDQCELRFPTKNYLYLHKFTIHDKRQKKRKSIPENESSQQVITTSEFIHSEK